MAGNQDHRLIVEAQSHDEAYRAMLQAALAEQGAIKEFAERTGIVTSNYLSHITTSSTKRKQKSDGPQEQNRHPRHLSPELAEKIAPHLPWNTQQRERFIEHVTLAHDLRLRAAQNQKEELLGLTLNHWVEELRLPFRAATSSPDHTTAKKEYAAVAERCKMLIAQFIPRSFSLDFVELCLMLSNVSCVLDQAYEAFFYAKYAYNMLSEREKSSYSSQSGRFYGLLAASLDTQATALHNLGLEQEAHDISGSATRQMLSEVKIPLVETKASSMPILTLCETARFSIREVIILAKDAKDSCNVLAKKDEVAARNYEFSVNRALGLAYLRYGKLSEAEKTLRPLLDQYERIPGMGLVKQVTFLRDFAHQRLSAGAVDEFTEYIRRALSIALDAGFDHQIRKIHNLLGEAVQPIYEELISSRG